MSYSIDAFENCTSYEEEYFVEKILDKRKYKDIWKYKVKWVGYSIDDCTWEPIENLEQCRDMVEKFEIERGSKLINSPLDSKVIAEPKNKNSKRPSSSNDIPSFKKQKVEEEMQNEINENETTQTKYSITKKTPNNEESNSLLEEVTNSPISKSTAENDDKNIFEVLGNFEEDTADKILKAKILNNENLEFNCYVQWIKREDGIQPESTWISSKEIYEKDPRLLIRFYETKIKLPVP
jgi:hypothetical protein